MFKKLKCLLGFHSWHIDKQLNKCTQELRCKVCNKTKIQENHSWETITETIETYSEPYSCGGPCCDYRGGNHVDVTVETVSHKSCKNCSKTDSSISDRHTYRKY